MCPLTLFQFHVNYGVSVLIIRNVPVRLTFRRACSLTLPPYSRLPCRSRTTPPTAPPVASTSSASRLQQLPSSFAWPFPSRFKAIVLQSHTCYIIPNVCRPCSFSTTHQLPLSRLWLLWSHRRRSVCSLVILSYSCDHTLQLFHAPLPIYLRRVLVIPQ
jgi:hypothetical protein